MSCFEMFENHDVDYSDIDWREQSLNGVEAEVLLEMGAVRRGISIGEAFHQTVYGR